MYSEDKGAAIMHSQELLLWLQGKEDEHLEFKEAKNRFDFEKLVKYCQRWPTRAAARSSWA